MAEPAEQALRDALAFSESIIDTVRDPLLVLSGGLRVVTASPEFYRAFGVTPEETKGRLVYELGNRQWDIPRLRTLLEEILPHNSTFRDFEVEHTFEHIGRKVMLLNARRLCRASGEREMIILAIEDVTDRRDAEAARREAEARFTEMVKHVRDHSIFLTDPDGVVTSWNVAAERTIGYPEAEAVGRHFSLIFTPEDVAAGLPEQELRQAREWGRAEDERWHRRKGGERFWALGIVTPLRDADGNLTGYSKILRDMTERKRAEEALRGTEEQFRFIVESARDYAIFTTDAEGAITSWSPGAEAVFGWPAAEAVGLSAAMTYTPEDRRAGAPEQERAQVREKGFAPDVRWHLRKDGTRVFIEGVVRPVSGGFLKIGQNVTEKRRAEESLRESEERLRVALAAGQMGTWLWRILPDEQVMDDSLRRMMGLPPGQEVMPLEGFLRAVHPEDRDGVRAEFERCLGGQDDVAVEFRVSWPDGSIHWLRDRGRVFRGPDGGPLFMAGACVDVTERRRMEDELRRSRDELEERVRERTAELVASQARALHAERLAAIGQTVTALAHEGRNALQRTHACLARLEWRLDGRPDDRALTEGVGKALGDLERLFDDVRTYAAPVRLDYQACDVRQVWREAWAQVTARHAGRDARLEEQADAGAWECDADPFRLGQVFTNLFANALEACPDPVQVTVSCRQTTRAGRPAIRVSVRDNGPGFPPEQKARLFEPFHTTKPTGTGLGLAITKRLAEAHGGEVTLGEGPGAEVVLTLPRSKP